MREAIFSRIWIVGWLTLFLAPVVVLEVSRELSSSSSDDEEAARYVAPTPEFVAAMHVSEVASADR